MPSRFITLRKPITLYSTYLQEDSVYFENLLSFTVHVVINDGHSKRNDRFILEIFYKNFRKSLKVVYWVAYELGNLLRFDNIFSLFVNYLQIILCFATNYYMRMILNLQKHLMEQRKKVKQYTSGKNIFTTNLKVLLPRIET